MAAPARAARFVILTMARTGSNALCSALHRHPEIACDYELFHPDSVYTACPSPFTVAQRDRDPWAFLDAVRAFHAERRPAKVVHGFKLFFGHAPPVERRLLEDPSWRKLLLRRRNSLDQYVSERIALEQNAWSYREGGRGALRVEVDLDDFAAFRERAARCYADAEAALAASGQEWFTVQYDDVAAGRFDSACEFLGVAPSEQVHTKMKKQNSARSADKIANAAEVRAWLCARGLDELWVE